MTTRRCSDCEKTKDVADFYVSNKRTGARQCRCKRCANRLRTIKTHRPCTLCGGPKGEGLARAKLCPGCRPWAAYAGTLRKFRLTPADYVAILKAQGGGCAICGGQGNNGKRLGLDHDHAKVGRESVRGILCDRHNRVGLWAFDDDVMLLMAAIHYLLYPPARRVLRSARGGRMITRATPAEAG